MITTFDYIKAYYGEKSGLRKFLAKIFKEYTVIFIGYSLQELELLENIIKHNNKHYYVTGSYLNEQNLFLIRKHYIKLMTDFDNMFGDGADQDFIQDTVRTIMWNKVKNILPMMNQLLATDKSEAAEERFEHYFGKRFEGLDDLELAEDVETLSRAELAMGASDVTQGMDAMRVAERVAVLSDAVAEAGVTDLAEGAELLATSEDLEIQGAIVGALAEEDLGQGMDIAAIAGQLFAASEIIDALDMPVLASFLDARGQDLHELAVDAIFRFGATRALSEAVTETGLHVGEMGILEVEEGIDELVAAEGMAYRGEELAEAGLEQTAQGIVEIAAAEGMREASEELAAEGVAEVAEGAAEIGAAATLADFAAALEEDLTETED